MIQGKPRGTIACCSKYTVTPKKEETLLDCYILKYRSIFREWPKKRFVADVPIQVWDFFVSQVSARVLRVEPPIHRIVCSSFFGFPGEGPSVDWQAIDELQYINMLSFWFILSDPVFKSTVSCEKNVKVTDTEKPPKNSSSNDSNATSM